jgi:hypothetical protein
VGSAGSGQNQKLVSSAGLGQPKYCGFCWSRIEPKIGKFCEHDNEPSGSLNVCNS